MSNFSINSPNEVGLSASASVQLPSELRATSLTTTPHLFILEASKLPLKFGVAPLRDYQALVRRLGAENFQSVYLLLGESEGRLVARGGKTKDPLTRLGTHSGTIDLQHFTHVALVAGPALDEDSVAALEVLVLRQIEAVGAVNPGSKGPEMLKLAPAAWSNALDSFLFFRWALTRSRITLLEPDAAHHPASLLASASGISDRWKPNAVEARKSLISEGGAIRGATLDFNHGDFISIAEIRGDEYWLLAGSEIRSNAVPCARKKDRHARDEMLAAGHAAPVRGFPDRLEMLVDRMVGYSEDRLTKFVLGSACSENHWRPLVLKTNEDTPADHMPTV